MDEENFVSFGEEGAARRAQLTYGSYLRLPQLLDAQHLESDPPAHDELLFITIHQVYELWFQQLLHEVQAVRDALLPAPTAGGPEGNGAGAGDGTGAGAGDRLWWARHLMNRVHVIERVLLQQVDVLETMTPQDFLEFRQRLAPASGFQSVQFRELEFLSGAKDSGYLRRFRGLTAEEERRLELRLEEPSLWDAFLGLLEGRGLATGDEETLTASLRVVAHDRARHGDLWAMAEALILHDELAAAWRARHVVMVERMIGARTGTGGSTGATYLRSRLGLKYYPVLWDLRSAL